MRDGFEQQPFVVAPDGGTRVDYLGGDAIFKITNEQTGGWGFAVETFPGGFASALHNHPTEDSGFYILSGQMRVICGNLDATAGPGGFIWLPRGVPHAFKVVSEEPCTWINVQGPTGDFRRLVEATSDSETTAGESPEERAARMSAATRRHHLELLGPPPF